MKTNNDKYLEIRTSQEDDAFSIIQLLEKLSYESENLNMFPGKSSMTIESEKKFIRSKRENPKSNHLVAIVDNKIVGMCGLNGRNDSTRISHRATLGIGILKDYWGLGIGYQLMSEQIKYAKKAGLSKINLEVKIDNTPAIRLYEKCGFEIEGTIKNALRVTNGFTDCYLMGLVL